MVAPTRIPAHGACAGVLALALALAACADAPASAQRPDLVLIVLDTTRPDYLSPYGGPASATPFLDSFASTATRFERAYSSSSWTLPAHATMFTGTLPGTHRATQSSPFVKRSLPLLAETLDDAGYVTAGFSANPWIGNNSGLKRGFRTFARIDSTKKDWLARRADDRTASESTAAGQVAAWLAAHDPRDVGRPFFLFVNLMRAHHPYVPSPAAAREVLDLEPEGLRAAVAEFYPELPDGHARSLMNRHYAREAPLSEDEWQRLRDLYRASLRSADDDVRAILELLDGRAGARETLVVIASDHGESLGEHEHFGHILNLYEPSVRVVLLARGRGFEAGTTEDTPVHLADVHATFLAAAGLPRDPTSAGVDLARERPRERTLSASLDAPSLHLDPFEESVLAGGTLEPYRTGVGAAIHGRYKLIATADGREELYDVAADPAEAHPLDPASIDADVLAALRDAAAEALAGQRRGRRKRLDVDDATLESLRALGYAK